MSKIDAKALKALVIAAAGSFLLAAPNSPTFDADVKPILHVKGLAFHTATDRKGKLNLSAVESILEGGTSGPAVIAGSSDKSLLITKIVTGQMPPVKGVKLADTDIDTLRAWI